MFALKLPSSNIDPDNVNAPLPCLTKAPEPPITPEKVLDELSPPTVKVLLTVTMTLPPPASEPTVSLKLPRSNVAPDETVTADELVTELSAPSLSVPPLMLVAP